jgi:hypothetical protein
MDYWRSSLIALGRNGTPMMTGRITYVGPSRGLGQTDPLSAMNLATDLIPTSDPFANIGQAFGNFFSTIGPLGTIILIVGGYALVAMVFTTSRGVSAYGKYRSRGRAKRRKSLEKELKDLDD